jgi:hypothetical protein
MKNLLDSIKKVSLYISPSLAKHIGFSEAIVLDRLNSLINIKNNLHFFDNRYWISKSYNQWREEFPFWCNANIRRAVYSLEKKGFILSFRKGIVKYYSIDMDTINQLLNKN